MAAGLVDAIVEVTETGSTIKAHGLKIVHELFQSNTQFIANNQVWENDATKREKMESLSVLLLGALRAERMVGLKMNIPGKAIEEHRGPAPQPAGPHHRQPL